MKKNLLLRLCLMTVVVLSFHSCRQDLLHEQETYHNTSAFQLTSKRISLNEAKHKAKLVPELGKVEAEFKAKIKNNAFGKIVNYGNGVSIDTDDVIYIENGPDYYTYTFRINRENTPADAPVENLVLSPLSDGSWKEVLITYNLTAQEKQTMLSGAAVNLAGKVTQEMLQSGTYSSGIMGKGLADECFMMTYSYYTSCSENAHHHGEAADEDGGPCEAETQSVLVVTQALVCPNPGGSTTNPGGNESGTIPGGFNPSGGGATTNPTDPSGSNGSTNPENPCGGSGIPSQPQEPSSTLGNQPCNNGTPTLPNLVVSLQNDPCKKIKTKFTDTKFKAKVNDIDKPSVFSLNYETGFAAKYASSTSPAFGSDFDPTPLASNGHTVKLPSGTQYFGFIHSHVDFHNGNPTIKIFSPGDVGTFLTSCLINAKAHGSIGDAFAMVITSQGNYILQYTESDDNFSLTNEMVENWNKWYKKYYEKLVNDDRSTQENVEKLFMKFLSEKVNIAGTEMYKIDKGTGKAYKMNNDGTKTPCP